MNVNLFTIEVKNKNRSKKIIFVQNHNFLK